MYPISNGSVLVVSSKRCQCRGRFSMNRKSCTIVYGLFYRNIRCTRILGTLWRMHRQCVPGPLFGPGDEAKL